MPHESEIDAFLRQQCQGIERWTRAAGEAVRAEVERAVVQGLSEAFRRLAEELPRILTGAPILPAAPPFQRPGEPAGLSRRDKPGGSPRRVDGERLPAPRIPDAARAQLREGRRCAREGDARRAAVHFTEAIGLCPDYVEAHLLLGGVYLAQSQWEAAVAAYTEAVRLEPGQAVAFLNRGLAHAKLGDSRGAIADADEALRLNPDMAEAYYLRAVACTRQRKDDQAVADLTRLLELQPGLWRAHYTRGLAHANRGDYDRAVVDFGQALRLEPGFLPARFQRGVAYRLKGENTFAIREFDKYLQEKPDSVRALVQRGLAHLAAGCCEAAIEDFDRAIELNPGDAEVRSRREEAERQRDRSRGEREKERMGEGESCESAPSPLSPSPAGAAPPNALWLTCPECGASAPISWKRLNRKFQCRGCKRLFHVDGEGRFTEVQASGRPPRRWPIKRALTAAALCLIAVAIGWFYLRPHASAETPLPQDLKARAELWGKAWVVNDHYLMRRLTDPTCDKALHPWLQHHQPPPADAGGKKSAPPEAEIEAHVDRTGDHQAILVLHIKSGPQKAPIEMRLSWVERGDSWYFVPS